MLMTKEVMYSVRRFGQWVARYWDMAKKYCLDEAMGLQGTSIHEKWGATPEKDRGKHPERYTECKV